MSEKSLFNIVVTFGIINNIKIYKII